MTSQTSDRPALRRTARAAAAAALALAVVALAAPAASAHDRLVGSDPEPGAVLDAVPAQVVVTFSAEVQELGTTLELQDSSGALASEAPTQVEGRDVVLPVPADLAGGDYTLVYRVTSSDGHPVDGEVPFTLDVAAATGAPATTPAPTAAPTTSAPTTSAPTTSSPTTAAPTTTAGSSPSVTASGAVADDADPAAATTEGSFPWVPVLVVVLVLALGGLAAGVLARRRGTTR